MKNTLVINLDRCTGCDSCVAACKLENEIDLGVHFNQVFTIGPTGTFPNLEMYWLPHQCQQCENPGCIEVCPTGASYRDDETGVVLVDYDTCIGCETCIPACPYEARMLNKNTNVVQKCTLCFQRRNDEEWKPACVSICCCGALTFGDLDDPSSEASKALVEAGEENCHHLVDPNGLKPTAVFILSEKVASWQESPEPITRMVEA